MHSKKNLYIENAQVRNRKAQALLLTILILALSGSCENTDWMPYSSEKGGFEVSIPGSFRETIKRVKTPLGDTDLFLFITEEIDSTIYFASFSDYPNSEIEETEKWRMLKNGRDRALQSRNGRVVSEKKVRVNGNPGIEFKAEIRIDNENAALRALSCIVGGRYFQIFGIAVEGKGSVSDVERFIRSFKVKKSMLSE